MTLESLVSLKVKFFAHSPKPFTFFQYPRCFVFTLAPVYRTSYGGAGWGEESVRDRLGLCYDMHLSP